MVDTGCVRRGRGLGVVLAAVATFAAARAGADEKLSLPPSGSLRKYVEPTRSSGGSGLPALREGWRLMTQLAPIFPTSDLGNTRDLMAATTGFSPRINVGYEYLFGELGVTPGVAVQLARFGMEYQDGSVLYAGLQPNVQATLHLGRFAPYASVGVGVDHFHLTGDIANLLDVLGGNTSTTGIGFDVQVGANVAISPSTSLGLAWQIHPGFTTFKLDDTDRTGGSMAFMSVLFGATFTI
jgi:hypothetical protein